METEVQRIVSNRDATIGLLFIDGRFECFTLEDEPRIEKVAKETRIPAGRYRVGVRTVGRLHERYNVKFAWHRGMLEIIGVPNFSAILFHIGNYEHETDGCLLVGSGCTAVPGDFMVTNSTAAYERFYQKVIASAVANDLMVTILDLDSAIPDS